MIYGLPLSLREQLFTNKYNTNSLSHIHNTHSVLIKKRQKVGVEFTAFE